MSTKVCFSSFVFFLSFLIGLNTIAQDSLTVKSRSSSVYVELVGNGALYSVNWDETVAGNETSKLKLRIGGTYIPSKSYEEVFVCSEVLLVKGKRRLHPEFGLGVTLEKKFRKPDYGWEPILFGTVGCRYENNKNGLMFRFGFAPICFYFNDYAAIDHLIYPLGGISVGYSF